MEIKKGKFYYNKESNELIIADKDMVVVDNLFTDKIAVHTPTQEDWDFDRAYDIITDEEWRLLDFKNYDEKIKYESDITELGRISDVVGGFLNDSDKVSKPSHYSTGIDTFARMEANCSVEECIAFAKGNIDKYNWRNKGQDIEDFDKIIAYANWGKKLLSK